MSKRKIENVKCDLCLAENEFERYIYIDLDDYPNALEDIIDNRLFHFICNNCQNEEIIQYPLFIIDKLNRKILYLHDDFNDIKDTLDKYLLCLSDDYQLELVKNVSEFVERAICWLFGYDYRIILVYKALLAQQLDEEIAFINLKKLNSQIVYCVIKADKSIEYYDFNEEYYQVINDRFGIVIEEYNPNQIDEQWVNKILQDMKYGN
ncbi:MAG: CpXC domain-containing protein [Erysipelotrichaceae bacterium]